MDIQSYFIDVLRYKYSDFTGRASRSEYWVFTLFKWLSLIAFAQITALGSEESTSNKLGGVFFAIIFIAYIIPSLAVAVRRLHDTGKSGLFFLLGIIPIIGALILFVFYLVDSDEGVNKYGPNPYEISDNVSDQFI